MKNILILCDDFPPVSNPRMGYLCRYLPALGWNPIVVTEFLPQNIYADLAKGQNAVYINYYFSDNKLVQLLKYIFVFFADFLFDYKNRVLQKKAEEIIKKHDISLILSSSFRVFPALAAHHLSKKYNIPFVMDLRDIFEQSSNNELVVRKVFKWDKLNNFVAYFVRKKLTRQRNRILKNTDAVTTVSPWHVDVLSDYNRNVTLIYNGYDSEIFSFKIIENKKFIITFTGRLYSRDLCDPTLLFEAVKTLADKKIINSDALRLHFYLKDDFSKQNIKYFAGKYQISNFIDIFEPIQNSEVPEILNKSAILLVLANQAKEHKGIMGTKTFEYLAVEKPILCVRNDEDCLEQTINTANAGLAASTVEETERFILENFSEWQQNGYTHQAVNRAYIAQFSRKYQAGQFAGLFDQLTK